MEEYKLSINSNHTLTLTDVPPEMIYAIMETKGVDLEVIECMYEAPDTTWEEYEMSWEDFEKVRKPYAVRKRSDKESEMFYMFWFDGKKSHQKSTRSKNYQQACKNAKTMWKEMKFGKLPEGTVDLSF